MGLISIPVLFLQHEAGERIRNDGLTFFEDMRRTFTAETSFRNATVSGDVMGGAHPPHTRRTRGCSRRETNNTAFHMFRQGGKRTQAESKRTCGCNWWM